MQRVYEEGKYNRNQTRRIKQGCDVVTLVVATYVQKGTRSNTLEATPRRTNWNPRTATTSPYIHTTCRMIKPMSRRPYSNINTPWLTSNTTHVQISFGPAMSHDQELTIKPPCPPFLLPWFIRLSVLIIMAVRVSVWRGKWGSVFWEWEGWGERIFYVGKNHEWLLEIREIKSSN